MRTLGKRISNNHISRREFLQRAGVGVRTTMLAACMPEVFWAAANRFVLGVSTSIFPGEVISVEEYALLEKYGITSVEIGYEHSGPALFRRGVRDRLFTLIKDAHTPVYALHAPYKPDRDISVLDEKRRHLAVQNAEEALELANQLGAKLLTIHGSQDPILQGEWADRCAQAHKSLDSLAIKARRLNLRLALETMPPDWLPSDAPEALKMVEGLDPEVVGFCLDTNHSNLTNDLTEIIQALSPRIWNVHLSDNDGLKQRHWMPFKKQTTPDLYTMSSIQILQVRRNASRI